MSLRIEGLCFAYRKGEPVIEGLDLEVNAGGMYSVLGDSGSGKTTLLKLIAGFIRPIQGQIFIKDRDVSQLAPEKRRVGMVFQNYALFPHMNVVQNVMYGIDRRSRDPKRYARKMLHIVGLDELEERPVTLLSGGQGQRVALARALAHDPDVLLLDEPLSALDASLREGLRTELRSILKERGVTSLYITHDQLEALSISDRIGFLERGRIFEQGFPEEIYWKPKFKRTARFMGVQNIYRVRGMKEGYLVTDLGRIPWRGESPGFIGVRPESFSVNGDGMEVRIEVVSTEYRGHVQVVHGKMGKASLKALVRSEGKHEKGDEMVLHFDAGSVIPLEVWKK
ncbi:MAG: ABC transporter ATP-binding protein [Thermoplasmatota archaeon]